MLKKAYIIARPLGGSCGIGHQFYNWVVAWQLAYYYDLQFVHAPFCGDHTEPQITVPVKRWEKFLGFGQDEIKESQLSENIHRIKLPRLPWEKDLWLQNTCNNPIWKRNIEQYDNDNTLFECAKNQFIRLDPVCLQHNKLIVKYWQARQEQPIKSTFNDTELNIAIHIRRGDVTPNNSAKDRWMNISVYINIINQIYSIYGNRAVFHIYSDGTYNDIKELVCLSNIVLHLKEDVFSTFHHMIIADILVVGKSSFSALAGHLCSNIKIVQSWNSIANNPLSLKRSIGPFTIEHLPSDQHFVLMNDVGKLSTYTLQKEMENIK